MQKIIFVLCVTFVQNAVAHTTGNVSHNVMHLLGEPAVLILLCLVVTVGIWVRVSRRQ